MLEFDPTLASVIVADIGGTKIALGHLERGLLADSERSVSSEVLRVADPAAALGKLLTDYANELGLTVEAAVLGVPTSLSLDLQTVLSSPNIPQLEGRALGRELGATLRVPVFLERDINLLLLGEARAGAARGSRSVLGVFFGTGVGAAWLNAGELHRGHSGAGLELGHIPVRSEGRRCVCGNLDCLEAYACGHTLRELAERHGIAVAALFAERHTNPDLERALAEFVRDEAYALATAINLFDPEVAVIGGGLPDMADYPFEALEQTVLAHLRRPNPRGSVRLQRARLGRRAALWGALSLLERQAL